MTKEFYVPSFAKATEGCLFKSPAYAQKVQFALLRQGYEGFSLSSALVTEEIYVQAGTEAEAFSFADIDKPWGAGSERFHIDALGHEEDLV